MKTIKEYLGFGKNDIVTLSDLQTQTEFNMLSVDFIITEVRTYKEPSSYFTYTCYFASYKPSVGDEQTIMLMVRQIGANFDLRVFYMDSSGPSEDFVPLFDALKDDLIDRFNATLHFGEDDVEVTWDRQGDSKFGIETKSTQSGESDPKTIAEYFTADDSRGNPHCFIEWTGNKLGGFIEVWYGCEVRVDDVELLHNH
ncbi:MAG: hypothetical protein PHF86_05185 [Candidatus Nanoarchaeia archaeon]|jgi:hypothetical protein|nr:hypothetical protein [Candidatus Nanoarchaeia archaeon]